MSDNDYDSDFSASSSAHAPERSSSHAALPAAAAPEDDDAGQAQSLFFSILSNMPTIAPTVATYAGPPPPAAAAAAGASHVHQPRAPRKPGPAPPSAYGVSAVPLRFSASFLKSRSEPEAPLFQQTGPGDDLGGSAHSADDGPGKNVYGERSAYDDGSAVAAYLYGSQQPSQDTPDSENSFDGLEALGGQEIAGGVARSTSSSDQYAWAAGSHDPGRSSMLRPSDIYLEERPPPPEKTLAGDPRAAELLPADLIPPSLASELPYRRRYRDPFFAALFLLTITVWAFVGLRLVLSTSSKPLKGHPGGTAFSAIRDTAALFTFMIGCALAGGAAWIWWLRRFVKPFVWVTLTFIPIISLSLFLWTLIESFNTPSVSPDETRDTGLTIMSFVPLILGAFWSRAVYKKRKQIHRTVAVIELSCEILRSHPTILVYSFFLLVAYTIFTLLWIAFFSRLLLLGYFTDDGLAPITSVAAAAAQLNRDAFLQGNASLGEPLDTGSGSASPAPDAEGPVPRVPAHWALQGDAYWGIVFFVGVFFWTSAVFGNLQRVGISGVVAYWYFHRNDAPDDAAAPLVDGSFLYQLPEERPADVPRDIEMYAFERTPTHVAFRRAATTLLGPVCLGGLVLGSSKFLQFTIGTVRRRFRRHRATSTVLGAVAMVAAFVDGIVESINNYCLIYVGLSGESFCQSARKATKVFRRNLISGFVTDLITRLVLYLLAFTMASVSAITVYLFASHSLHSPYAWFVSAVAMVVPAYIGVFWGRVLTNTIDALYMAYAIDMDTGTNHCSAAHKAFGSLDQGPP